MNKVKSNIIITAKNNKLVIFFILFLNILVSLLTIAQPLIFKDLFDVVLPTKDINRAIVLILILVILPIFNVILGSLMGYFNNDLGNKFSKSLRIEMFNHLLKVKPNLLDKIGRGEIINRLTTQIGILCEVFIVNTVLTFVSNIVILISIVGIMFYMNSRLTIISLVSFPIFIILLKAIRKKAETLNRDFFSVLDTGMNYLNDFFSNIKYVRIYNGEKVERENWEEWNNKSIKISQKTNVFHNMLVNTLSETIISVITGIVYGFSLFFILYDTLSVGSLLAFIVLLPKLYNVLKSIFTLNVDSNRIKVILENLNSIFNLKVLESGDLLIEPTNLHNLNFEGVCFSYTDEKNNDISNINLNINGGEFVGIVGLSGGGKSTIFDLIHRQIDPMKGKITLNNIDIREYKLSSLRKYIGYTTQKNMLWNKSILENIIYPLRKEELSKDLLDKFNEVVKLTHVDDFVDSLAMKYHTLIENNGNNFSGGEVQRILLARTFMNDPKMLLLDEYTSALDAVTESKITDTLENLKGKITLLVIAHRLSTVKKADKIVVIDKGKIIEEGTWTQLLSKKGVFYKMYKQQRI